MGTLPGLGAVLGGGFGAPDFGKTATGGMRSGASTGLVGVGSLGSVGGSGSFGSIGGVGGGADPLRGTEFLLAWGGDDEADEEACSGRRWQLWGQGDVQTFQGAPSTVSGYDGDLRTAYVGVDTWLTDRWLAGVAVARSPRQGPLARGRDVRVADRDVDSGASLRAVVGRDHGGVGDGRRRLGRGGERAGDGAAWGRAGWTCVWASPRCGGGSEQWAAA